MKIAYIVIIFSPFINDALKTFDQCTTNETKKKGKMGIEFYTLTVETQSLSKADLSYSI